MNSIAKKLSTIVICLQCLVIGSAMAHPGHDHVLTDKQAVLRGKAVISSLISQEDLVAGETLDESWKQATDSATCKEIPEFYLISFDNQHARKTLYILLTAAGKYLRANFDGHFAELTFSPYPLQSC